MAHMTLDSKHTKPKWALAILTSALLALGGCSVEGTGGDDPVNDGGPTGGNPTGDNPTGGNGNTVTPSVSFNLSGAVSLVANEDAIVQGTDTSTFSRDGRKLFSYSIARGFQGNPVKSLTRESDGTETEENQGVSNLLAIDAQGNASLALHTNVPMKVMYSVASPDGSKVYIALDTGWDDHSGTNTYDYASTIAALNCGLLEVDTSANSHRCVAEGLFVQKMDDEYQKAVSGNQKPIQFDEDGNMYFAATSFTRQMDSWCSNFDENGNCIEENTWYWLDHVSWDPRVYKMDASTGDVDAVTQDNEIVTFFLVLPSGELAYQSWQTNGNYTSTLYILQGNSKINLTDGTGWIEFFTVDTGNTVIFGDGNWGSGASGVKLARPTSGGGIFKSALNTSLFGDNQNGNWSNPTPRRIILADDGRVYGVFEGGRSEQSDPDDSSTWQWIPTLKVYQVLPYDGVPKVELDLDPNSNWWDIFFAGTPFQIAKGFLYYTRSVNVEFGGASFGDADIIEMVKLATREKQTLLMPATNTDPRYEMYNWRLSGTELFFSGLDKSTNTVVTGTIDTLLVRDGAAQSEFLELKESASALGAASKVQDIEVIGAAQPAQDSGGTPKVDEIHADQDNLYSVSIDFTKHMNKETVESNLALKDASDNEAYTMKVWLHKTLHLIVDRTSLSDDAVTPMQANTTYTLDFEAGTGTMRDAFGVDLSLADLDVNTGAIATSFTTRPNNGWYIGTSTSTSALVSGDVLKYAGPSTDWEMETFLLRDLDSTSNVRVEFSAKNLGWDGPQIILWDNGAVFEDWFSSDWWARTLVKVRMSGWSDLNYKTTFSDNDTNGKIDNWMDDWDNGNTETLFNGQWKRYRIDFYGTKLRVYVSEDGTTYTEVSMFSKDDLAARSGTDYHLLFRVNSAMVIDDLKIQNLDSSGVLGSDILSEDFGTSGSGSVPSASPTDFSTDVNDSAPYNLDNW